MDEKTIQTRDLKVIDKISKIRKRNERLERRKASSSKLWKALFLGILVIIIVKLVTEPDDKILVSQNKDAVNDQSPVSDPTSQKKESLPSQLLEPLQPETTRDDSGRVNITETQNGKVETSYKDPGLPAKPATPPEKLLKSSQNKLPQQASATQQADVAPEKSGENGGITPKKVNPADSPVIVAKSVVCKEVKDRKFVDEQYLFSIKDDNTPMVWMDARAKKLPQTLKHIYFHNQEKYCEVSLAVKYPRMRTWSYVTLDDPVSIGSWTVHIVTEEGDLLSKVEFEVVP